jgi:hypothetical protein
MDEESFYKKEQQNNFEILIKVLKEILDKQENKNIIDKNRLKEIVNIKKNIDKTIISADLETNINNITEFYTSFDNANKKQ